MKKSVLFFTLIATFAQASQQPPQGALANAKPEKLDSEENWNSYIQRITASARNRLPCASKPDQATYQKLVRDTAQETVKNNNSEPLELVIKKGYRRPWTKEGVVIETLLGGCSFVAIGIGLIAGNMLTDEYKVYIKNNTIRDACIIGAATVISKIYFSFVESTLRKKLYSFVPQQKKGA